MFGVESLFHGEAVAYGMIAEARVCAKHGPARQKRFYDDKGSS